MIAALINHFSFAKYILAENANASRIYAQRTQSKRRGPSPPPSPPITRCMCIYTLLKAEEPLDSRQKRLRARKARSRKTVNLATSYYARAELETAPIKFHLKGEVLIKRFLTSHEIRFSIFTHIIAQIGEWRT